MLIDHTEIRECHSPFNLDEIFSDVRALRVDCNNGRCLPMRAIPASERVLTWTRLWTQTPRDRAGKVGTKESREAPNTLRNEPFRDQAI